MKTKKIIAYKVLRNGGNWVFSGTTKGKSIKYNKTRWTRSPKECGPLAVFETFSDAYLFLGSSSYWFCIYKCEIVRSKYRSLWYMSDGRVKRKEVNIGILQLPKRTMFADKVKLLEKVTS